MFKSYLHIAARHLTRHRLYALTNVRRLSGWARGLYAHGHLGSRPTGDRPLPRARRAHLSSRHPRRESCPLDDACHPRHQPSARDRQRWKP